MDEGVKSPPIEEEVIIQRKRLAVLEIDSDNRKIKVNTSGMFCFKFIKALLPLLIILTNAGETQNQRIYFSNNQITLHAIKGVSHDTLIDKNVIE